MKRILLLPVLCLATVTILYCQNTVGTLSYNEDLAYDGYNILYPHNQSNVYLINNCGDIVHMWGDEDQFRPGNTAYILPNGNLVKTKRLSTSAVNDPIWAGGGGETVDVRTWDNDLINSFTLNNEMARLHHDIAITDNGTILMIAWELKTREEAISAGRDTALLPNDILWPDYILEWDAISNEIIWEWNVWDHLIQDYDSDQVNFGVVADNPQLIDINYDEHEGHQDWLHSNSIDYNSYLDQIVISVPYFNELWIIDHSTTSEEAASHQGGNSGNGGDILFRWGNPQSYDAGTIEDKKLLFQHDVKWVNSDGDPSSEDFGLISMFNNRVGQNISTLNAIRTQFDMNTSQYVSSNGTFLPTEFEVDRIHPDSLVSASSTGLSSVQILPNNNILALSGRWGYAYEITPDNELAWEYVVPLRGGQPVEQGAQLSISNNITFRLDRYAVDYAGFVGRELIPGQRLEVNPNSEVCDIISATEEIELYQEHFEIIGNPINDVLILDVVRGKFIDIVEISGLLTKRIEITKGRNKFDISTLPIGIYILRNDLGFSSKFLKF